MGACLSRGGVRAVEVPVAVPENATLLLDASHALPLQLRWFSQVGEEGGLELLCDMLHSESHDVLSMACVALAAACEGGLDLEQFGTTSKAACCVWL